MKNFKLKIDLMLTELENSNEQSSINRIKDNIKSLIRQQMDEGMTIEEHDYGNKVVGYLDKDSEWNVVNWDNNENLTHEDLMTKMGR